MTNQHKSMEFWYGTITFVLLASSVVLNESLKMHEKILTLALMTAIPWVMSFLARKDKEVKEQKQSTQKRK